MDNKLRIAVIVNKSWEFEPFFNAITNSKLKNAALPLPDQVNLPFTKKGIDYPLAVYNTMKHSVQLHCIENWMKPGMPQTYYSNSKEKVPYINNIIHTYHPNFIISVSTAESTPDVMPNKTQSINGSVLIGSKFFMFDARKFNPTQPSPSNLEVQPFNQSQFDSEKFWKPLNDRLHGCADRFIPALNAPANKMICGGSDFLTSIGVVNIVEYAGYAKGDPAAYATFVKTIKPAHLIPASIETTHGIVKMIADKIPTIFVSPITDRYEHFSDDVDAAGIQNYIAGFNAGIAVSEILAALENLLS